MSSHTQRSKISENFSERPNIVRVTPKGSFLDCSPFNIDLIDLFVNITKVIMQVTLMALPCILVQPTLKQDFRVAD